MTESDGDWLRRRIAEIGEFDYSALQNDLRVSSVPEQYEESASRPRVEVRIWMPDIELTIQGYMTDLELRRDFIDATAFGELQKTYMVKEEEFTLHGRRALWVKKPRDR